MDRPTQQHPPAPRPHHRARAGHNVLLAARRHADLRDAGVLVVANDRRVAAAGLRDLPPVAGEPLDGADNRALGHLANREHVANCELRLLAHVQELASVDALRADHNLVVFLVAVCVAEAHMRDGRATSGVVLNGSDDAADVAVALCVVELAQPGGALLVGLQERAAGGRSSHVAETLPYWAGTKGLPAWACRPRPSCRGAGSE